MRIRLVLYLLAFIVVVAIIAIIYMLPVETAATLIIALLILVYLAIITAVWGARPGAISAVIAFLFFNYFFTQPYFEFSVHRLIDVGVFIIFLLVTILVGQLVVPAGFVGASDHEIELMRVLIGDSQHVRRRELTAVRPQRQWKILSTIIGNVLRHMEKVGVAQPVEVDISRGLPLLFVEPLQMEYVFTSLVSKISKYAASDTTISIGAWAEGEFIHIRVSNQSPQLPHEEIEDILNRFNPGMSAARSTDNGAELSICQNIITAHGGLIWAENTPEGLAFHFLLPLS